MKKLKDHYQTLQVDPAAEIEVISAAYKKLALKYHPDMNGSIDAKRRMQDINEAYQVLSNPVERERYDLRLQIHYSQKTTGIRYWRHFNQRPHNESGNRGTTSDDAKRITKDDKLLGFSSIVIYTLVATLLFIILSSRVQNLLIIILILIMAGVISVPIIFRVDDRLNRKR